MRMPQKRAMNSVIEVDGLTRKYNDLVAVDHIDFSVQEGEIFGFLGPNGAGKTTTVRMLSGLITPTEGKASGMGFDLQAQTKEVKAHIGVVQDISNLYPDLTCYENLIFSAQMYGVPRRERKKRALEILERFNLLEKKEKKFLTLSRGMKRKLTITCALIHRPPLLFLDEPTLGLDVRAVRMMHRLMREVNREGTTIFLTTHQIAEAGKLCDRIAIINKGKLLTVDTVQGIRGKASAEPRIRVSFDHNDGLASELSALPSVSGVRSQKDHIHLSVGNISLALREITKFAESKDLVITSLHTEEPSLEEAFVQLTGIDAEKMK